MTTQSVAGVLERLPNGSGVLRSFAGSFRPGADDVQVSKQLIAEYGLVSGATVVGETRSGKGSLQLATVTAVCGWPPERFQARPRFENLTAVSPTERFRLGDSGRISMRIVDLVAPIGKGSRGLIVAPPKSGKTQLLEEIAAAIHASEPETRIIVLLIDERPEEVTHFRRAASAEVLASSSDEPLQSHINLAELTLAHIRCELECGRNVVVLLDSLTRMVRAVNLGKTGVNRTLSGGLDAKALEMPRRFFGLARNIEGGGSITVIATALIETGSRMDDLIFQEFKSTGNSELVLSRALAEARIFPAIDVLASGTRREELLYCEEEMRRLTTLRRWLAGGSPKAAMSGLLKLMAQTSSNTELLARLKPAQ